MIVTAAHINYARSVAARTMRTWPYSEWDDGYADAMVGLMTAARNFRPAYGTSFTSFAFAGIRGAVIDGLEVRIGKGRTEGLLFDVADPDDQYVEVELSDRRRLLVRMINGLSARSRLIVTLYFFEGMTLRSIGDVLGLTESRLSQVVRQITTSSYFAELRAA